MKRIILIVVLFISNIIFSQEIVNLRDEAEKDIIEYDEYIKANPKDGNAYYNRGFAKMIHLEDYKGAISDFNIAIALGEKDAEVYYLRGDSKYFLEDYHGAIIDYTAALAITKSRLNNLYSNDGYEARGMAKYMLKNFPDAIKDFTESLKLNSKNSNSFFWRGLCKIYKKQKNSGCLDLSKAGELGYDDAYEMIKKYCNK